jgi:AAA domain
MLKSLHLKNVGPAPEMTMALADRLNLITGDNGLGKSFLLDVAWWALTRRWPQEVNPNLTSGYSARPTDVKKPATIEFSLTGKSKEKLVSYTSTYAPRDQAWSGRAGRPWNPGLVIYAHADGGFSVWDPARNYWKKKGPG